MNKVFGIVGWSGSGKTDLTTRIISYYSQKKIIVSSIKHTHHDFEIDKEGKDSQKHVQSGANEVILYNEKKWALISKLQQKSTSIYKILEKFEKKDQLVLIEGLKHSKFPKLEVIRSSIKKPYIYKNDTNIKAIVIDQEISDIKLSKIPIFKFSETENIGNFILEYFKR